MFLSRTVNSVIKCCAWARANHHRDVDRKEETMGGVQRRVREVALALVILVACLGLSASGASAERKDADHCIAPNGVDLNELFGVSEQIIVRFCAQADAGQRWTHSAAWLMAESFEAVPPEFVPAGATPLDDFLAKFVAVKYVSWPS